MNDRVLINTLEIMSTYTCNVSEPYFSQIESGTKTYEGRIRRDKWSMITVGDTLVMNDQLICRVTDIVTAGSFDQLHAFLGNKLLPDYEGSANELYSSFPGFSNESMAIFGVVGVGIKRI